MPAENRKGVQGLRAAEFWEKGRAQRKRKAEAAPRFCRLTKHGGPYVVYARACLGVAVLPSDKVQGTEEIFAAHLRQPGEAKKVRKRFLKRRGKTCVAEAVFFHKACSLGELPKPKHKLVGIFTTCKFMTKWRVFA